MLKTKACIIFFLAVSTRDMLYESIPSNGYVMQLLRPEIPQFLIPISIFSSISCVNLYTNVCTCSQYTRLSYSAYFNINMKNGDKNNNNNPLI